MPEASSSIVIARPLAEVFAFFTTPAQDLTWRDGVKDIHSHGEPAVGAVVHQVIAGPFGKGIAADIEITEYAVDSAYGFRVVSGPVRPVGRFTFAAEGDGTRVDFALRAEITGLKRAMMSKPVQKSMDAEVAALAKAKAILEG